MVEGHSVHRVATAHRTRLVGRVFAAASPNGRFAAGAALIDGKPFAAIEAVGKNLFAFFGSGTAEVCVHIHFGMAGNWAVFETASGELEPATTATTRLRLEAVDGSGLVAHLSAMTVNEGTRASLYAARRCKLGEDPLRADADVEKLWRKCSVSKKSIGALIMDQSYFCGPGNIYRAEILFKAGVHPDTPGRLLTRQEFDTVWRHTVALLQRGYQTGSILTVDAGEFARGSRHAALRRYVYNNANCPRCATPVLTWQIAARTCYACPTCQPRKQPAATAVETTTPEKEKKKKRTKRLNQDQGVQQEEEAAAKKKIKPSSTRAAAPAVPFLSHCARESFAERLRQGGTKLTVAELRAQLRERKAPTSGLKADLVQRLDALLSPRDDDVDQKLASPAAPPEMRSALEAAADKARAGENRAVEHIAELHPSQTAAARRRLVIEHEPEVFEPPAC